MKKLTLPLAALALTLQVTAGADTVHLTSGRSMDGIVTRERAESIDRSG